MYKCSIDVTTELYKKHQFISVKLKAIYIGRLCHIGRGFFKIFLISYNSDRIRFATEFCNFIIRNYIQLSLLIRSIVLSMHT